MIFFFITFMVSYHLTVGKHVINLFVQYTPYKPLDGSWEDPDYRVSQIMEILTSSALGIMVNYGYIFPLLSTFYIISSCLSNPQFFLGPFLIFSFNVSCFLRSFTEILVFLWVKVSSLVELSVLESF